MALTLIIDGTKDKHFCPDSSLIGFRDYNPGCEITKSGHVVTIKFPEPYSEKQVNEIADSFRNYGSWSDKRRYYDMPVPNITTTVL